MSKKGQCGSFQSHKENCLEPTIVRNFEGQASMISVTLGSLGKPSPDPGNLAGAEDSILSGHVLVLHLLGPLFIL